MDTVAEDTTQDADIAAIVATDRGTDSADVGLGQAADGGI